MGFVLVLSLCCWVVAGIRLGRIRPVEIHATLSSGRITVLIANLNFEKSVNELASMLQARRLGLFREYNLTIRNHPELLEEIADAVAKNDYLQKDHRRRNSLFNYHLIDLLADNIKYRNVGLSYESMQDVLRPSVSELMLMSKEDELLKMSKAVYMALDYLHFVIATFETTSQYDIIIEALVRIRFILNHVIDEMPAELEKNTRQLRYIQWNLESALEKNPTVPLRKIRAYYCKSFKNFEIEKGLCEDEDEHELQLMLEEVEHGIWEDDEPNRLKSFAHIRKYQRDLAEKCNLQLIYMLNSPTSVTKKVARRVMEVCGNGLMSEDTLATLIIIMTAQGNLGLSYTMIEALLPNIHDIVMVHRKLAKFLHFSSDHRATGMALQASLMERRGFLVPMNCADIQMYGVFEGMSIEETRRMVMDRLSFHTDRVFEGGKSSGNLLKMISDYGLLAVRLRISLKGWWRMLCFEKRELPSVRPLHLIMSVIMAPISEIVGKGFTIRDIYGALLDDPSGRTKK